MLFTEAGQNEADSEDLSSSQVRTRFKTGGVETQMHERIDLPISVNRDQLMGGIGLDASIAEIDKRGGSGIHARLSWGPMSAKIKSTADSGNEKRSSRI